MSNKGEFSSILSVKNKLLVLQTVLLGTIIAGSGYSIFGFESITTFAMDLLMTDYLEASILDFGDVGT